MTNFSSEEKTTQKEPIKGFDTPLINRAGCAERFNRGVGKGARRRAWRAAPLSSSMEEEDPKIRGQMNHFKEEAKVPEKSLFWSELLD